MQRHSLYILLVFVLLGTIPCHSYAQGEGNNWHFGVNCVLDFNTTPPTGSPSSLINTREGCAAISDAAGNLKFYTDGVTVWANNNTVMPNGTNLMGNFSATQSGVIVPKPGNPDVYYVFTVPVLGTVGFRYSEVDMTLNNGLGDVTSNKNILLFASSTEKVTAVAHGNGTDYWVIGHNYGTSYHAYHVSSSGVNTTAVTTNIGTTINWGVGYLKASPQGDKIANANWESNVVTRLELFDFDNMTGVLSNYIPLNAPLRSYGVEFSPDGQVLYMAYTQSPIYQYDLTTWTAAAIQASQTTIGTSTGNVWALQLGPDEKIYTTRDYGNSLGVINFPNTLGTGCNFVDQSVSLGTGQCRWGFPTFIQSFFNPYNGITFDDTCHLDTTSFFLNSNFAVDSVFWDFDDPGSGANNTSQLTNPEHIFTDTGTFMVTALSYFTDPNSLLQDTVLDTVFVNIHPVPEIDLGNDTVICDGDSISYQFTNTTLPMNYLWSTGSLDSAIQITSPGTYWLEVNTLCGTHADTIDIDSLVPAFVDLGPDSLLCDGDTVFLDATVAMGTYFWQDSSTNAIFPATQTGTYTVISTNFCRTDSDTIDLTFIPPPEFFFPNDSDLCDGQTVGLSASGQLTTYLWHNGNTGPTFLVNAPGTYWVEATNVCGTFADSATFYYDYPLNLNLGGDTVVCVGNSYLIDPATGVSATTFHLWHDGSTDSTFVVSEPGFYWLETTNTCGVYSDSVLVEYEVPPVIDIGDDQILCTGNTVHLDASFSRSTYTWSTGSVAPSIDVTITGTYSVTTTNLCGSAIDEVQINFDFPLNVNLGDDQMNCKGDAVLLDATAPNTPTYLWNTSATTPSIEATINGRYSVTVSNTCGDYDDEVVLFFLAPPNVEFGPDTLLCDGTSMILEPKENAPNYLWQDSSRNSSFHVTKAGRYWLEASNECGSERDDIQVDFAPLPEIDLGEDTVVCPRTEILELNAARSDLQYYQWQDGTTQSSFPVIEPGIYWVKVTDFNECSNTDVIVVRSCPTGLFVPNSFTPDGDLINDRFQAVGENIVVFSMRIFNRWGQLVFHSADINDGWDGRYGGEMAANGTYSYLIHYIDENDESKTLTGKISLIR